MGQIIKSRRAPNFYFYPFRSAFILAILWSHINSSLFKYSHIFGKDHWYLFKDRGAFHEKEA